MNVLRPSSMKNRKKEVPKPKKATPKALINVFKNCLEKNGNYRNNLNDRFCARYVLRTLRVISVSPHGPENKYYRWN